MEGEKANLVEAEKREEAKLMQKYPQHIKPSNFLQKKLNRGQKYFDSGDYNMQKQAGGGRNRLLAQPSPLAPTPQSPQSSPVAPAFPLPTVDSIHLQQRKASISQSKLAEESATPHVPLAPQSEQLEQSSATQ